MFGDGTVVIKAAPGHSPGHQVLFLKLAKTGPVLLTFPTKPPQIVVLARFELIITAKCSTICHDILKPRFSPQVEIRGHYVVCSLSNDVKRGGCHRDFRNGRVKNVDRPE